MISESATHFVSEDAPSIQGDDRMDAGMRRLDGKGVNPCCLQVSGPEPQPHRAFIAFFYVNGLVYAAELPSWITGREQANAMLRADPGLKLPSRDPYPPTRGMWSAAREGSHLP